MQKTLQSSNYFFHLFLILHEVKFLRNLTPYIDIFKQHNPIYDELFFTTFRSLAYLAREILDRMERYIIILIKNQKVLNNIRDEFAIKIPFSSLQVHEYKVTYVL